MTAALILLLLLAGAALPLWLHYKFSYAPKTQSLQRPPESATAYSPESGCCGMHITCERDSLLTAVSQTVEYYDDEELDRYAGIGADDYETAAVEQFRDVLETMAADDIAGWARSLQLRGITLPSVVRDELLMIVSEARAARINN